MKLNEMERQKEDFLAVGDAYKATPMTNFCIRGHNRRGKGGAGGGGALAG